MDSHLHSLEAESIYIIREVAASFQNPVMLYSVGKDSSVMLHLARKAFFPAPIPFPVLHVDTGYKFPEMYKFRDDFCQEIGIKLIVYKNGQWINKSHPEEYGTDLCCSYLKTQALLNGLKEGKFDAAMGGARRDEEKSRAKERVFSLRDSFGKWNPKKQRPEAWYLYNTCLKEDESMRIFPLSNWTELDVWHYIDQENIPVVPLYFAKEREVVDHNGLLIPLEHYPVAVRKTIPEPMISKQKCRFRSLGCIPCTGAISSPAATIAEIIEELKDTKKSERENRKIDFTSDSSMEQKKREGYF